MQIKKVAVNITERDITSMIETICKEPASTQKANQIADLFTELLLKSTEASTLFVQIMLGNGLPEALREGDVIRCKWDRLKVGLTNADDICDRLHENNLINEDDEVVCMVKLFRGYTEYFPYTVEFKYGEDLYASCSMGFEDVLN
jgi:hypothetical protein